MKDKKQQPGYENRGIVTQTAGTWQNVTIQKNGVIRIANSLRKRKHKKE
ncbi:MAG: hypothetical protein ACOC8S_05060 [Bacteroidota bacterium]